MAWPLAAGAQQPGAIAGACGRSACAMHVQRCRTTSGSQARIAAFLQGLRQAGLDRRPQRADRISLGAAAMSTAFAEHARRNCSRSTPDVILASGTATRRSLLQATPRPCRSCSPVRPIRSAPASSQAWRGRAATPPASSSSNTDWAGNGWSCSETIAPGVTRVAVVRDAGNPAGSSQFGAIAGGRAVASDGGRRPVNVRDAGEIDRAIATFARSGEWRPDRDRQRAVAVSSQPARYRSRRGTGCRSVYSQRDFVDAGGLMSYGANVRRAVPARGRLRRPHPQGREAGRPAGAGADQVRAGRSISRPPRRSASGAASDCSPAPTR